MTDDAPVLRTAPNFRDLGGYAAGDGTRVRRGLLYRSDGLSRLDDADLDALARIGVRQLLDLRTEVERATDVDRVPEGAEYAVLDVQGEHTTGGDLTEILADPPRAWTFLSDNGAERFMHEANRLFVGGEDACAGYRELVERAATGPTAVVFHCTAGKDRTGWGAAVILTLLGVPRATVVADYLASNERLRGLREWVYDLVARTGIAPDLVAPLMEVRAEYLETAFTEVDRVFGSFDGYVADGLKLSAETVAALRARMLE